MTGPNIVVIITDQQRADLTAREGFPLDVTPFTDSLATQGMWFERAYTTAPVCAPARTSLITGRYPSAHRVTQNAAQFSAVREADIFSVARQAGYSTALIGKNHTYITAEDVDRYVEFSHNGQLNGRVSPAEAEFDGWLAGLSHRTAVEPSPGGAEVQNPFRIVTHALEWLDELPGDAPFLLQLSFPEPHNPYQAPAEYFDLFPPESIPAPLVGEEFLEDAPYPWRHLRLIGEVGDPGYGEKIPRARSNYLGMLRFIDDQIARFVTELAERGFDDNTLLLVTSDHGDYFGEYGLMRKGAGVPECLMRIPLVAYGPGVQSSPQASVACVSLADVLPTLCDYMGASTPAGVQGATLRPLLEGRAHEGEFTEAYGEQGIGGSRFTEDELVGRRLPGLPGPDAPFGAPTFDELNAVSQAGRTRMVRAGDWKLVADGEGCVRLYNLVDDPREVHDLAADGAHEVILGSLMRALIRRQIDVEDVLPIPSAGYERAGNRADRV